MYRTAASAFIHILKLDESTGRKGAGVERIKTRRKKREKTHKENKTKKKHKLVIANVEEII